MAQYIGKNQKNGPKMGQRNRVNQQRSYPAAKLAKDAICVRRVLAPDPVIIGVMGSGFSSAAFPSSLSIAISAQPTE
jgi:hypothetical protein